MKKLILVFVSLLLVTACSSDDGSPTVDPNPTDPVGDGDGDSDGDGDGDVEIEYHVLTAAETRSYMVDQNATAETAALFYNLKTLMDTQFIIGQQDAFAAFYNDIYLDSDMKKTTGSDPGLLGSDFMFITDKENNGQAGNWFYQQELDITEDVKTAYDKGMINAFTWHLREPYEQNSFYTSDMTQQQRLNAFKSIVPGGENHELYKEKLQKIAAVAKTFIGSDGKLIPVIFRPFHEFDGDFFWWGAPYSTANEFKAVWQFTVEYLRDELEVRNFLYCYAPDNSYTSKEEYLQRYPGDEYIDILAMDNYGDFTNQSGANIGAANSKLKLVSELALEKVKIAAMSETGFFVEPGAGTYLAPNFYSNNLYKAVTDNDVKIAFLMFWQNSTDTYTIPVPGVGGVDDFRVFIAKDETVLLNDMPDMYTMPN